MQACQVFLFFGIIPAKETTHYDGAHRENCFHLAERVIITKTEENGSSVNYVRTLENVLYASVETLSSVGLVGRTSSTLEPRKFTLTKPTERQCKMEVPMRAVEMTGTVDENHQLQLDGLLPFAGPKRVRVIVLSPLTENVDDFSEMEWLKASLSNPVFEYLRDPEEDIYTISDGKPFYEA